MRTLSFTHVRQTTNKLVNILANEGVICAKSNYKYKWIEFPQGRLREECLRQGNVDWELYQSRGY